MPSVCSPSQVGIFIVKLRNENEEPMKALNRGYYVSCHHRCGIVLHHHRSLLHAWQYFFACGVVGIILCIVIVYITQYYTAGEYRPVREIAKASETGPATNIITGFSIGLETTAAPIIAIGISSWPPTLWARMRPPPSSERATANDKFVFGLFGTAVATMGMLATAAFVLAMDTFGPDHRQRRRHQRDVQPAEGDPPTGPTSWTRSVTPPRPLPRDTRWAPRRWPPTCCSPPSSTGRGLKQDKLLHRCLRCDLAKPPVFVAGLIGGMLVFLFASLAIRAVGKAAYEMIDEVRRQFKEHPGILAGTDKPDYALCVDISTKGALKAMILPGVLPVVVPLAVGLMIRYTYPGDTPVQAVGAFLMVATIAGILMATVLNNGGGAWDNAKKYIESGHHGGKKTPAHAAAVVGDTVGDPFKDTAGPSLHVLVKLLSTITLVFAALFIVV